jgi:hypothetical protein
MDSCSYGKSHPIQINIASRSFAIPDDVSSRSSPGLVSHKENVISRFLNTVFQVIDDSSSCTHAASGDDHTRTRPLQKPSMFFMREEGVKSTFES